MTALRKALVHNEALAPAAVTRAPAKIYAFPPKAGTAAPESAATITKNIALFLAAPFIGLAYIVAFPLVGLGVLAVLTVRAAAKFNAVRNFALVCKHIGMAVAAPVIGLAYVVFFPVICLGLLAWTGGRAIAGTNVR